MKLPRWIRRVKDAARWVDKHLLTVGGWRLRPIVKMINRKKDPHYLHRKEKP